MISPEEFDQFTRFLRKFLTPGLHGTSRIIQVYDEVRTAYRANYNVKQGHSDCYDDFLKQCFKDSMDLAKSEGNA